MVYSFNQNFLHLLDGGSFILLKAKQKPLPANRKWLEFNNRMY